MAADAALLWLNIAITSTLLVVFCVAAVFRRASRSTPPKKPPLLLAQTQPLPPPSDPKWAQLETDQAELFSTLGKLTTTVKRLSSRAGMQDVRARGEAREAPPKGTSKAELLRFYGMSGKVGPSFAQAQLELDRDRSTDN